MPFAFSAAGLSDIGRARLRNEDSFVVRAGAGIAVIADGMGGHPGGDLASRLASREAMHALTREPGTHGEPREADPVAAALAERVAEAVEAAHAAVRARIAEDPTLEGMGTTLTAFLPDAPTGAYAIGHVGDSRAYRLRGGRLLQLTRDETWVQDRVDEGQLTLEQARRHPYGHLLTNCVGLETPPEPQVVTGHAEPGDLYLLCTDGLVGMLDDETIAEILTERPHPTPATLARGLVDAANAAGGRDNITVALVRVAPEVNPPPAV